MPSIPAMLETRVARLPAGGGPSLRRTSPVGRSRIRVLASGGAEGEVKVYASLVTRRLISLYGNVVAERYAMEFTMTDVSAKLLSEPRSLFLEAWSRRDVSFEAAYSYNKEV